MGGLPASSAGFLGLVQEVVILLFYETSNKSEGAARLTLRLKRRRRAVRDAAAHLVHRTTHCGPWPSDLSDSATRDQMTNLDLSLRWFLRLALRKENRLSLDPCGIELIRPDRLS